MYVCKYPSKLEFNHLISLETKLYFAYGSVKINMKQHAYTSWNFQDDLLHYLKLENFYLIVQSHNYHSLCDLKKIKNLKILIKLYAPYERCVVRDSDI